MEQLNTIVFIGVNKSGSSRDAIKAAEKMGYFTVVFTNRDRQIEQREEYPDVHEMIFIDTENLSIMRDEIKKLQIQGKEIKTIVSFINSYIHTASLLCDEFCQSIGTPDAIFKMEDKVETRNALEGQPYNPKFFIVNPNDSYSLMYEKLNFPVMVKSPKSTGSKDALFAENPHRLQDQMKKLTEKYPEESIIIEEYIDGDQYLVEAIIHNSKVYTAAIIEQEITQGKRFIVTGYGVLASVPEEIQTGVEGVLNSIVSELGLKNGSLHLELRHSKNGWKLIEVNPRISGGAMNQMIHAAFGYNVVEETLKLYLGETPILKPKRKNFVFTQYMIISKKGILERVTGRNRARRSPGVIDVYIKPRKGTRLIPPLSMGHRYAYVMAAGHSLEEAKANAKNAANEIEFHLIEE
ncbi:ATP-grasp domain-containing protein [Cytobacillus sp. FJAT-54145]|uniref:ATP-grasp domain-containing protein n=1 Tax=Cytobacillus spartinae TaxID=3299023 RepID=A0ABW6K8J6_9BACI